MTRERVGETPKRIKKIVRARMKETGEKYTVALRAVLAELEAQEGKESDDKAP